MTPEILTEAPAPVETQRVRIILDVELDVQAISSIAERQGVLFTRALAEVVGDCECRAHDALRWRDAVVGVGVRIA